MKILCEIFLLLFILCRYTEERKEGWKKARNSEQHLHGMINEILRFHSELLVFTCGWVRGALMVSSHQVGETLHGKFAHDDDTEV